MPNKINKCFDIAAVLHNILHADISLPPFVSGFGVRIRREVRAEVESETELRLRLRLRLQINPIRLICRTMKNIFNSQFRIFYFIFRFVYKIIILNRIRFLILGKKIIFLLFLL